MKSFLISILLLFFMSSLLPANYVENTSSHENILVAKKKTRAQRRRARRKARKAKIAAEKKAEADKIVAEKQAKLDAENKVKAEAKEKLESEERARVLAVAKAKIAADEKAKAEAEEKAKLEVEAKAKLEAEKKANENLFSLAFKVNLTVPTSQINTTYALHLEARYHIIKELSVGLDLGYYPMSGEGENLDPQIGLYDYKWSINSIPVYLGVNYSFPILKNFLIEAQGGFAAVFAFSEGETFNGTNEASDLAYGYYLGVGAILRLGSAGDIIGELRYTGMYLDFEYPEFNEKLGDMGGKSILVGYRYIF